MTKIVEKTDASASLITPYIMTAGDTFQGNITAGDSDWIKVTLVAGKTYTFGMVGIGALNSGGLKASQLVLHGANGAVIASNTNGGPGNFSNLTFTATTSGSFYIEAKGLNSSYTGNYMMSLTEGSKASFTVEMGAAALYRSGVAWTATPNHAAMVTWAARASYTNMLDAQGHATVFSVLTTPEINAIKSILGQYSDVCGLTFQQVNPGGTSNNATILFSNYRSYTDGAGAFAYFPGSTAAASVAGDVQLNTTSVSTTSLPFGSYSYFCILHELGHSMGLDHPGDYNAAPGVNITYPGFAQFLQDSNQYTVMSYFGGNETGAIFSLYPSTLMLYDVYALQQIYGVNLTTRTGNTTYGFNSNAGDVYNFAINKQPILCIWDSGGTDTLDVSGFAQDQMIDLNQGAFSNIGGQKSNVSIAYGTVIENAVGGSGNDLIIGNDSANRLTGGLGNDVLRGGNGADTLEGGAGDDTADYSDKTQTVTAILNGSAAGYAYVNGLLEDTLYSIENLTGGAGNDTLTGDNNANVLSGGAGDDTLTGGAGGDRLIGGSGKDRMDGGTGTDTADYSDKTVSVQATLNGTISTTVYVGGVAEDTIVNFENLIGGSGNDVLTGAAGANRLEGGAGDDGLNGAGGDDVLVGGLGKDRLDGGSGSDTADYSDKTLAVQVTLNGANAATVYVGGVAEDTVLNIENVTGGSGNDILTGDNYDNVLNGGAGNDVLTGGSGHDTFVLALGKGVDRFADFNIVDDLIALDRASFGISDSAQMKDYLVRANGAITASTSPGSSHGYFIISTSGLYWDDDGRGSHAAVKIADVNNCWNLVANDFVFI